MSQPEKLPATYVSDAYVRELVQRVEALQRALKRIAANTCCDSCREAALVARKVLKENER